MRALIIEDQLSCAETLQEMLKVQFCADIAPSAQVGEKLAMSQEYDLILLDMQLPDRSGIDVCRSLRHHKVTPPILFVTGTTDVQLTVEALDSGADDYIVKPFDSNELLARIRAALRRHHRTPQHTTLEVGDLTMYLHTQTVTRSSIPIPLRRKEYQLLEYLVRHRGRIISRETLLEHVWQNYSEVVTNTVDVHIKHLRDRVDRKFSRKLIKTVHGLGYKIEG